MDTQTLIKLLLDVKTNLLVFYEDNQHQTWGISSISSEFTNENHYLILNLQSNNHSYQVWELITLLKTKSAQALVYVKFSKKYHQIFGLRFGDKHIYLK